MEKSFDTLRQGLQHHQNGNLRSASRLYEKFLHQQPGHSEAIRMQANIALQRGLVEEAEQLARKSLSCSLQSAPAYTTLGKVLVRQGRIDEALIAFERAVELDGKLLDARLNLARTCQCTGNPDRAIDVLTSALVAIPDNGLLCKEVALTLNSMGRYEEAGRYFHAALDRLPDSAESHSNPGAFYLDQGNPGLAAEYLQRALEMRPGQVEIRTNLAMALRVLGDLPAALDCLRTVLSLQPGNPGAATMAASILHLMGEYAESRRLYEEILAAYPRHEAAVTGLAELLEWNGEYEAAIEHLQLALDKLRTKPALVVTYARVLRRVDRYEEATSMLEDLLESNGAGGGLDRLLVKQVHFTLADLHDDQKRYDAAWRHYTQANCAHWVNFDMPAHLKSVEAIMTAFDPDEFARLPRSNHTGVEPVFLIGMPRSGTSLVEQILAAHPSVHALGENALIANIAMTGYPDRIAEITVNDLDEFSQGYLTAYGPFASAVRRITDKTTGNFMFLGLIELMFPNAKIIHCCRNPLDTMLSCYFTDFLHPALAYSFDLEQLDVYYRHYQQLMDHWKSVLSLPILDFSYEDLVLDQEPKSRELLEFTGLPWNPGCLEFHRSTRVAKTASHAQVRKPIYTGSIGRSDHYPQFLESVIAAQ